MQNVILITVGSLKKSWIKEGCKDYADRIRRDFSFELIELSASKQKEPQKQLEEESNTILDALKKRKGLIVVLDELGEGFLSTAFADFISALEDRGDSIIFIIGGAYGLNDAVRSAADRIIKLSDMTLPHELCRILFLEQLYRASQICKKTGYHH